MPTYTIKMKKIYWQNNQKIEKEILTTGGDFVKLCILLENYERLTLFGLQTYRMGFQFMP